MIRIPVDLLIIVIIGGIVGYFLTLAVHITLIVLGIIYYYKNMSHNDGDMVRFFWIASATLGIIIGDIAYVIPHININLSFLEFKVSRNWFLR